MKKNVSLHNVLNIFNLPCNLLVFCASMNESFNIYCNMESTVQNHAAQYQDYANAGNDMINIYPNPVSDVLNISYVNLSGTGSLKVYTLKGKQVKVIPVNQKVGITQLSVSDLPNGIYILSYNTANSRDAVKFTVSH